MKVPTLTTAMKSKAVAAISAVHKACGSKDGIIALSKRLDEKHQSAAKHIYELARLACRTEKKLVNATVLFRAMCAHAEFEMKTRLNVVNLKEVVPAWAPYKSTICRGMNLGISPLEHSKEREFRDATVEAAASGGHDASEAPAMSLPTVQRFIARESSISSSLQGMVQRLMLEAQYVKRGKVSEAQKIFQRASEELAALLDHKAVGAADEETKAFVGGTVAGSAEVAATLQ